MAASLERAFEFGIRVLWRKLGASEGEIDIAWKSLEQHSERQLGAFCALWLIETRSRFPLDDNQAGFRNKVIHKGRIPNHDDVEKYAAYVFSRIAMIVSQLNSGAAEAARQEIARENRAQAEAIPDGMESSSMASLQLSGFDSWESWVDHIGSKSGLPTP
jgi:hypothetical protein